MAYKQFRADFISGSLHIDLKRGISINATVRYKEEKIAGVWTIKERSIFEVHAYQNTPYQASFLSPYDNQSSEDDD